MKKSLRCTLAASVAAMSLAAPTAAEAAVDMFLKVDNMQGESMDAKHKDEIDVLAWSWGLSSSGGTTTLRTHGCLSALSLTKYIDKATPKLYGAALAGTIIPKVKLTVRKAGEVPIDYFVIDMERVSVNAVSSGGSGGEDRLTENISLTFFTATVTYTGTDPNTGGPLTPIPVKLMAAC